MAHQYALSVSHDNLRNAVWRERLAESDIVDIEYSCGPFRDAQEITNTVKVLEPIIQAGHLRFPSLHLPYCWGIPGESPGQPDAFGRNICTERLKRQIRLFAPLGIKNATLHPGALNIGQERSNGIANVRLTVENMIPVVEQYGVSLNLEICPRGEIGGTPDEMEALIDGMPECVGICFDVNHADLRHAEVPEWIARLGKRIRTFHISDCDGLDECHWFPGFGILDWKSIMQEINRLDHDCVLIWEVSQDACKTPAFVKHEADPVWFLRQILKNMEWLRALSSN